MNDMRLTIRCVYLHNGGFFSRNKEMPKEDFEALKKALDNKVVVNDSTGRVVYAEEAYKTI